MGRGRAKKQEPVDPQKRRLQIKLQIAELEAIKQQYISTNKAEFATFLPHQQRVLDFLREKKKTILMVTGNRGGKTTIGAIIVALLCVPELRKKKRLEFFDELFPVRDGRIRILCKDWEHFAAEVIVPVLKEWIPAGTYTTKKNNVGVDAFWTFPGSGWTIELITNVQPTENQEGWKGHFVWQDETTTRDKYVTNKRGLIDYSGVYLMTFTAVDVSWVLDDIILNPDSGAGVIQGVSTYENTFLNREDIETYEKTLTDTERKARISGGFLNYEGRVWKNFDITLHTCTPFKVPPDWPVEFQIDFHLSTKQAVIFTACDKYDRYFVVDSIWANTDTGIGEIGDEIIRRKQANQWRLSYGEIDALSKGDTSYTLNRYGAGESSFEILRKKLSRYGIRLKVGSKDEKSYIKAVEARFKGPNGEPTLKIFNDQKEVIKQVQRWSFDDNGKPKDDGHFPECIGRQTQTGLKYTDPSLGVMKIHEQYQECPI